MRFLIDATLPPSLVRVFVSHGHEARAARDDGLHRNTDRIFWTLIMGSDEVIVTKDESFARRASQSGPSCPQVIWLQIENSTMRILQEWLEPLLADTIHRLQNGERVVELRR